MSERDGWNHLYLYDGATGRVKNQITKGEWVVRGVVKVDEDKRQIWFSASGMYPGKDPVLHALLPDQLRRLRPHDADRRGRQPRRPLLGRHELLRRHLFARRSCRTSRSCAARAIDRWSPTLEKADISALVAAGWKPPEVFIAKGRDGKTDIWGVIVRPTNFDPAKKYPVIENIYAGPHSSFVPKTFWPFGPHSSGDKVIGMQAHGRAGLHRRADRRHGDDEPIEGVSRRRVEERRRRRASRIASSGTRPSPRNIRTTTSRASASTAARPAGRTRSAACCSIRTSTRWRCPTPAATTTGWTRSAGTSSGWDGRSTITTPSRRTSTTRRAFRGSCCSSSASWT